MQEENPAENGCKLPEEREILLAFFVKFIILIHKIIFHKEYGSVAKSGAMR
ncbi:hypothetical protein CLOSTHATH_00192 [Hungatella hathewayi DSM 13479]|uniref:Uncharacterized protein n=1 Tax=Hungatella hathewayi DSM 13479 TaxID=566550 RepID=D3A9C1_9FIRM|nr:hypothetical protein CLOSTHATH_00192 [Hungatella hathewayi DSM 13479]